MNCLVLRQVIGSLDGAGVRRVAWSTLLYCACRLPGLVCASHEDNEYLLSKVPIVEAGAQEGH